MLQHMVASRIEVRRDTEMDGPHRPVHQVDDVCLQLQCLARVLEGAGLWGSSSENAQVSERWNTPWRSVEPLPEINPGYVDRRIHRMTMKGRSYQAGGFPTSM